MSKEDFERLREEAAIAKTGDYVDSGVLWASLHIRAAEQQIESLQAKVEALEEQLAETEAKVYVSETAAIEAELEDTITECLGAKSNEDILRKKVEELEGAAQAVVEAKPDSVAHCKLAYTINALAALLTEGEKDGHN